MTNRSFIIAVFFAAIFAATAGADVMIEPVSVNGQQAAQYIVYVSESVDGKPWTVPVKIHGSFNPEPWAEYRIIVKAATRAELQDVIRQLRILTGSNG